MQRTAHIYWFIVISLLLLLLDHFVLLQIIKNTADQLVIPVKSFFFTTNTAIRSSTDLVTHYDQVKHFAQQQMKLKQDNEELQYSLAQLKDENKKLRQQLDAPLPEQTAFIPATVITTQQTMDLAAGESSGIKTGMPVVSGVAYIGKIVSVTANRSQVQLLTDPDLSISGRTSRGVEGVVIGQPGGGMVLDKVLQKDPLFLDDQIVSSGDSMTPPNLLIGKIVHINASDVAVYKQAKINPPIDYQKLQMVFVIKSH
jgi:rod shape-determining protein MreC